MTFCEKIRNILKDNEFKINSASKLEEYVDVGRSSITAHYSKKGPCPDTEPGMAVQNAIKEKLRINKEWWETGEGEMFVKSENPKVKEPEKIDVHEVLIESIKSIRTLIDINDRLIVDKRREVDRLHEDKIWAYAQIDKLTSRIGGSDEPKQ